MLLATADEVRRRSGSVAACGARAAASETADHRALGSEHAFGR